MSYKLLYHPQCLKKLRKIPRADQFRMLTKLQELSSNPYTKHLDTKKLVKTQNNYRLRTGNLRAVYEISEKEKTIFVWEIDYRGNIY